MAVRSASALSLATFSAHNCWYARCIRAVSWEMTDTAPFNVFTILMISQSVVDCTLAGDGGGLHDILGSGREYNFMVVLLLQVCTVFGQIHRIHLVGRTRCPPLLGLPSQSLPFSSFSRTHHLTPVVYYFWIKSVFIYNFLLVSYGKCPSFRLLILPPPVDRELSWSPAPVVVGRTVYDTRKSPIITLYEPSVGLFIYNHPAPSYMEFWWTHNLFSRHAN